MTGLQTRELTAIRAALAGGASPGAALGEVSGGVLEPVARAARLGVPLAGVVDRVPSEGPERLLVRALAVAERAGVGGLAAVEQVLHAVRERTDLDRLLRIRTAQARVSARVLVLVPFGAWLLLTVLGSGALGFYTTPWGWLFGGVAAVLLALGWAWSARMVRRAGAAGDAADPLAPRPPPPHRARGIVVGAGAAVVGYLLVGPVTALSGGFGLGYAASRASTPTGAGLPVGGGAAEAVELVAIALDAGMDPGSALDLVAALAPPAARGPLARGARRLRGGWSPTEALGDGPLASLGDVLEVGERWGAPSAEPLRGLAQDLRADRRTAAEEAVERVQVALVFPTTLLTLPAFVLGVVPPLLWTAFAG